MNVIMIIHLLDHNLQRMSVKIYLKLLTLYTLCFR